MTKHTVRKGSLKISSPILDLSSLVTPSAGKVLPLRSCKALEPEISCVILLLQPLCFFHTSAYW